MKIALIQMKLTNSVTDNLQRSVAAMQQAALEGARVVCFPEIQLSPFFPQYPKRDASRFAMTVEHEAVTRLRKTCAENSLVAVLNLYLDEHGKRYDASPVIETDGRILGISKMVHIVRAPCFYEQDYYSPSDTGFKVYDTSAGKIGVVICFDRHFPESVRTCVLRGAQLIVVPTANTEGEPLEMFEWELRVAAMQNGVFIAMCNRVGREGGMNFCGQSIVVDPSGEVTARADDQDRILYAEVDFRAITRSRELRPFLELRRADAYEK